MQTWTELCSLCKYIPKFCFPVCRLLYLVTNKSQIQSKQHSQHKHNQLRKSHKINVKSKLPTAVSTKKQLIFSVWETFGEKRESQQGYLMMKNMLSCNKGESRGLLRQSGASDFIFSCKPAQNCTNPDANSDIHTLTISLVFPKSALSFYMCRMILLHLCPRTPTWANYRPHSVTAVSILMSSLTLMCVANISAGLRAVPLWNRFLLSLTN